MNLTGPVYLAAAALFFLAANAVKPRVATEDSVTAARFGLVPEAARALALEHGEAAADVVWLRIVEILGQTTVSEAEWDLVEALSEVTTDLDPRHTVVFDAISTLLSAAAHRVQSSDRMSLKWAHSEATWRAPFMIAYNAFFVDDEPAFASRWMSEAALNLEAPHYLASLAARMTYQSASKTAALAMIDQIEAMAPNERVLDQLGERRRLILTEERFQRFDQRCLLHRLAYGYRPTTPAETRALTFTMDDDNDFFGSPAFFDSACVTRSQIYTIRESENEALTAQVRAREKR